MKKTLMFIIALVFLSWQFNNVFAASNPTKGVVATNGGELNVRSGPSSSSDANVIGCLANGSPVTILSARGGWYKIAFGGGSGYVYASWIKVTDSEEVDYSSLPKEEQEKIGINLNKSADAAKVSSTVAE